MRFELLKTKIKSILPITETVFDAALSLAPLKQPEAEIIASTKTAAKTLIEIKKRPKYDVSPLNYYLLEGHDKSFLETSTYPEFLWRAMKSSFTKGFTRIKFLFR